MLAFVSQELMSKAREWWVAQHGKTNWKKWSADYKLEELDGAAPLHVQPIFDTLERMPRNRH